MKDLIPSVIHHAEIAEKEGRMPGTYSAPMKVERVATILALLLSKSRAVVENGYWRDLPLLEGGFETLAPYDQATDGL